MIPPKAWPPYLPALLAIGEWSVGTLGLGWYSDIKTVILRCSWALEPHVLVFSACHTFWRWQQGNL